MIHKNARGVAPQLEETLKLVIAGKLDAGQAKIRAEQRKKLEGLAGKFNMASRVRDWDKALSALGEMVDLDASNKEGIQLSLQILSQELRDPKRLRAWVESYVQRHSGDADTSARDSLAPGWSFES